MTITELAKQIGVSRELLHRHIKRGCPTDSLESALLWRSKNLDLTQTKQGRICGNEGGWKNKPSSQPQVNHTELAVNQECSGMERKIRDDTLAIILPNLYFERVDWLANALKEAGVKVTAEQVIEVQDTLYAAYLEEIWCGELKVQTDESFMLTPLFEAKIDSKERKEVIASLDKLLDNH